MFSGNRMVVGLSLLGKGPLPSRMQEGISPLLCVVLSLSLSLRNNGTQRWGRRRDFVGWGRGGGLSRLMLSLLWW